MVDLPARLRHFFEKSGLTREALAKEMDVTTSAISRWFTGNTRPTLENLTALVRALKIDLQTLFAPIEGRPDIDDGAADEAAAS